MAAHAKRVPVADHTHALGIGGNGEIHRIAAAEILFLFGAEHAVIVGRAGERGEDLLAIDDPAALDPVGERAEGAEAG